MTDKSSSPSATLDADALAEAIEDARLAADDEPFVVGDTRANNTWRQRQHRIARALVQLSDASARSETREICGKPDCNCAPRSFSDFIRNASPEEKEKVYTEVMQKATERQNAVSATPRIEASPLDEVMKRIIKCKDMREVNAIWDQYRREHGTA